MSVRILVVDDDPTIRMLVGRLLRKQSGWEPCGEASNGAEVQQSLLAQAKDLRQQYSGVSLDEEAMILIQFQRAYQATSKFLTVLDQLTQSTIDLLK